MDRGEDYISIMEQNRDALMLTTSQANEKEVKEAEKEKTVYNGYFDDADVQDRSLTDWKGQWQSVYPYLKDGTLDQGIQRLLYNWLPNRCCRNYDHRRYDGIYL